MYRVLLIDLWSGQGANPDTPRVLYETDNKANALHALAFYKEKYKSWSFHKVVLQQSIPTTVWETIKD